MTAKEFLKQYEYQNNYARRLRLEYEREKDLIDSLSVKIDGMPHGTNISKPTEDKALRLNEAFVRWFDAEKTAIKKRQIVFEAIAAVPGIEGDVLYERYVMLRKWEDICVLLHYSWYGVHNAHRRALRIIEENIEKHTIRMI